MLRQLEDENRTLKDTIFQANRELEKFYEQANTYITEREEYKRRFNDSQLALNKLQAEFSTAQSRWQSDTSEKQNTLEKLKEENLKTKGEIENVRRQSESMSQAQNETIQALQEVLREKEEVQKGVKSVPPSASFSPSQKSGKSVTVSESVASDSQSVSTRMPMHLATPSQKSDKSVTVSESVASDSQSVSTRMPMHLDTPSQKSDKSGTVSESVAGDSQSVTTRMPMHLATPLQQSDKSVMVSESVAGDSQSVSTRMPMHLATPSQQSDKSVTVSESVAGDSQSVSTRMPMHLATPSQQSDKSVMVSESVAGDSQSVSTKMPMHLATTDDAKSGETNLELNNMESDVILMPPGEFPLTCSATMEIEKLRAEREQEREEHDKEVSSLKETIEGLEKELEDAPSTLIRDKVEQAECECEAMRRLLNEAKELNKFYQNLPMDNLDERVRDLQQKLGAKVCEMSEYAELLHETQQKLCWSVCQNIQLKKEIAQLLEHINNYELSSNANDERTDYCQKEIEMCRGNLTEFRKKLLGMKDLLQKKVDQYSQLETEFCVQNNSLCCLRRQIDENKERYEKEVCDLRCTIGELQSKLTTTEEMCKCLREDYERSKAKVQNYTALDVEVEEKFENTVQAANEEITTLNHYIAKLQKECACISKELQAKNKLIETAQTQVGGIKAGTIGSTEEEAMFLADELDKARRQGDLLRAKNEALCLQLSEMQQAAAQFKEHDMANEQHVKKCLCEIHHLRNVRDHLDAKNQGYLKEIQYLRCAYAQLYENFQKITDALRSSKAQRCCCKTRLRGGQNVQSGSDLHKFSESTSDPSVNSYDTDELNEIQFGVEKGHGITEGLRKSSEFWQNRLSDDFLVSKDE